MEALSDFEAYDWSDVGGITEGIHGNSSDSSGGSPDQAFENLFPALVQCFAIIFAGYFAGRVNLLSPTQGRGLGIYVSKFAMPALLFQSMCKLHFDVVNWYFLASIFAAKSVVFILVLLFTLLLVRPTHMGKMGVYGIFATQSHDFALGIPIVRALYSNTHPEYEQYLYLIAPISVAILNPIGFSLMENYRWQHQSLVEQRSKCRALVHVLLRVVSNPIVFMTALGLVGNVAFHQEVPGILDAILKTLGDSFAATALFCLGHSMVGRVKSSEKGAFFTIALLIAAKMLLSPFLIRELVTFLDMGLNATEKVDMSTYGFLYGAFPTAPSVFIYATHYSMQADMMATGMVVSTFLSAPLMFVSARMITLPITKASAYLQLITSTAFDISIIGIICALWVLLILIIHRRYHSVPHRFTVCLLICQILACVGMILWRTLDLQVAWQSYIQFAVFFTGVMGTRSWTAMLATAICLLRARSLCTVLKARAWLCIYGFGMPVLLCGVVFMTGYHGYRSSDGFVDPFFVYGFPQRVVATVSLAVNIIIAIVALVIGHRYHVAKENCNLTDCAIVSGNCIPEGCPSAPVDIERADASTMTSSSLRNSSPRFPRPPFIHGPSPLTSTGQIVNGDISAANVGTPENLNSNDNLGVRSQTYIRAKPKRVIKGRRRQLSGSSSAATGCTDCSGMGCGKGAGVVSIDDIVPDTRPHPVRDRLSVSQSHSDQGDSEEDREGDIEGAEVEGEETNDEAQLLRQRTPGVRLIEGGCSPSRVRECATLLQKYQSATAKCPAEGDEGLVLAERDEHQLSRHIALVLFLIAAGFVGLCLSVWKLLEESPSGVYVEIEFLDVVLTFGQAIFTFVVFGLDTEMVLEPLLRRLAGCLNWCFPCNFPRWRRFVYRLNHVRVPHPEDLDEDTKHTCEQFVHYHGDACRSAIEGEIRYRWRTYQGVFTGRDLVDWLLEVGLVTDRTDAVVYGRRLVLGGVVEHIASEHHFQDMGYLYRMTQEAQESFSQAVTPPVVVNSNSVHNIS